ncbi:response regulator receiver protein [Geobacter metallireducens RCH3]|uniref:Response regulator n=1 Tax=Geobacter metallireducens (strain ATCC 53774 / DSM 7210 / GS-15) TaxID=269799 RepID=Q39VW2_GEOMG|nr:response regulator [Geobacter metallireducens]ABB31612.1 response regulator [Geobacter metallireducens GS-15]EHP86627.1 response regulator receiver protein [Geobacter metallireducens RCH3]
MNVTALQQMTVLFVDDEEIAREQMKMVLSSFCKNTICVGSADQALAALQEHHPDIVLTDIRMPGLSGIELLNAVKQKDASVAVVIVSAHSESEYLLDAFRYKADGYLLKPFNFHEMLELLSDIATQKEAASSERKQGPDNRDFLLKILDTLGGRRAEIMEYVINHLDADNLFHGTYDEVAEALSASKPTVVATFQIMLEKNVLTRLKYGTYRMNVDATI